MSFFGLLIPPPFTAWSKVANHQVGEFHEKIGWRSSSWRSVTLQRLSITTISCGTAFCCECCPAMVVTAGRLAQMSTEVAD